MDIVRGDGNRQPFLFALLSPHRSLSPHGFRLLMAFFALVSILVGGFFFLIGAWPIFGFYGLDILLLYLAFRNNYRSGALYETVILTDRDLDITHYALTGERHHARFDPFWVRLQLSERRGRTPLLQATSHGRSLAFGDFLDRKSVV
jgi:uncharacterized membrane protein